MIPTSNAQDLMLHVEVIEAVHTVNEGIEVLTGRPASEVHAAAKARLQILAETLENFKANASA